MTYLDPGNLTADEMYGRQAAGPNVNPLVIDIETVPLESALAAPYPADERQAPANYKNPDAIAGWHARDREAWAAARAKECSLNPRLGRVLCIGMSSDDSAAVNIAKTEAQEKELLEKFWAQVGFEGGEVVTWNGSFDLRFIVIRSMLHRITPTVRSGTVRGWFRRYSTFPHFDCRNVLNNWNTFAEGEGLTEWSRFFNLPERPEEIRGLTGADVYPLYREGKFGLIELYNAHDVVDTKAIFAQLAPMFDARSLTEAA